MLTKRTVNEDESQVDDYVAIRPDEGNPFPGLRPFTVDESKLYFGREDQVDDILDKLSKHNFICIMGYSGSGKSSLMSCGLVPVLHGGFILHSSPNWHIILSRPGTSPIQNLAASITGYLLEHNRIEAENFEAHKASIISVLRSGTNGLVEVSKFLQQQTDDNVFFMIDQFEELFRFHEADTPEEAFDETQVYINLILEAVRQRDIPVFTSVTMRSDFISKCSPFTGLTEIINESNYLVPQMTREQKRMAIEGPVAVAGGKISERLVKELLHDMGRNQDQLPILQHALLRCWDYWVINREQGEPIDLRHYNAIGRIHQALSLHANEIYEELSPRHKEIAEVVFKNITEKTAENRGMRRPAKLSFIAELAEADQQEVAEVVEHFRMPGRSFLMPTHTIPLTGDSVIELSHESLIRIWNRLNLWVEEEFESASMYKRISDAAAMYQIGRTGLWRPPDLQLALNWHQKQRPTREWAQRYDEAFERAIVFLDTSRITYEAELKNQELQQKRSLRRARATAIILGVAAVIALLFLVFAYLQKIEADKQKLEAQHQHQEAIAQREEADRARNDAEAQRKLVEEKNIALEETTLSLEKSLRQTRLARDEAQRNYQFALAQELLAKEAGEKEKLSRQHAESETLRAESETRRAEENLAIANRLYMLTIAQAMAGKSVQEDDDKDLAGALAMQAFHFHKRYDGKVYDPYLYNALYHALVINSGSSYNAIKVQGPARNRINSLAVSAKANAFYAAATDGRIFKGDYELQTSNPTAYQNPYPNKVIALSKDERYLVNGTDSSALQIFDLQSGSSSPRVVAGLGGATNAIEFAPDNSAFYVSKADRSLSRVDYKTGSYTTLISVIHELKTLSISPDGKKLVGGSWSGQLILIDLTTRTPEVLIDDPGSQILSVKFSPDGKTIAYGTFEKNEKRGLVKLFNLAQRKDERQFTGHKAGVYDVAFSPDGKLLASAGSDKRLQMWVLDFPEDLPIQMDNNNGFIWDIEFSRDSKYLIAACHESEIRVWPTDPGLLADKICPIIKRNMTPDEWVKYVDSEIQYETTCANLLIND
jgi:WD40 repeat protein/energy-coupling factor transporter ATP-binding protein EcfA2